MTAYLIQVSLCMAVFFAFYYFLLRRETLFHSNRLYLLCTLVLSFVLPALRIYILEAKAQAAIMDAPLYMASYVQSVEEVITIRPEQGQFPWGKLFFMIYAAVVLVLLVKLVNAFRSILRIRKNAQVRPSSGLTCVSSPEIQYPFSFFNTIYLPAVHGFSEEELTEVLQHEQAHVRGGHTWDVLLAELACIAMWPNPFVYLYRKALRDIHEFVADAAVLQNTPWDRYAAMLVAHRQTQLQMRLANPLIFSQLKKRLLMMNQKPSSGLMRLKYACFVPVLAFALVLFSFREKADGTLISHKQLFGALDLNPDMGQPSYSNLNGEPVHQGEPVQAGNNQSIEPEPTNPLFPGCALVHVDQRQVCSSEKLYAYIANHLTYPEKLKEAKVDGKVYVKFVVGADGWLKDIGIKKSLHPDADQVVLELVKGMNQTAGKWTPGTKNGKAVDTEMVLPVSFKLDDAPEASFQLTAEVMPRFPGCEHLENRDERSSCASQKLYEYIAANVKYPREDREKGIEGTGIVQFTVQVNGSMADIQVLRSPSPTIKSELERLFTALSKNGQKWIPAMDKGKEVNVQLTVPVKFTLSLKPKEEPENHQHKARVIVAEGNMENNIVVSPNPANTVISFELYDGAHTVIIVDAAGRKIITRQLEEMASSPFSLDISDLPPGKYVVQLVSESGLKAGAFVKE